MTAIEWKLHGIMDGTNSACTQCLIEVDVDTSPTKVTCEDLSPTKATDEDLSPSKSNDLRKKRKRSS